LRGNEDPNETNVNRRKIRKIGAQKNKKPVQATPVKKEGEYDSVDKEGEYQKSRHSCRCRSRQRRKTGPGSVMRYACTNSEKRTIQHEEQEEHDPSA